MPDNMPLGAPTVSITICMRNGAPYIHSALDSVFAQTFQDFEVILVDDGSTDGSADSVERNYPDPRLRIIRQRGQTLRVARPVALAHCTGEFITFIDHDDLWLPHKLERQLEAARRYDAVGLVFTDCFIIDADGEVTGKLSDQFDLKTTDLSAGPAHLALLRRGNFVGYSTAFARASAVRTVGGFSGEYQYVSDYDLWLRLARRHDLAFIDEPLAKYRVHGPQLSQRWEITLAEHRMLLGQVLGSASYPYDVRDAVADNLFGQQRLATSALWSQGRRREAVSAGLGVLAMPRRLQYFIRHRRRGSITGAVLEALVTTLKRAERVGRFLSRALRTGARGVIRLLTEPAALARSAVQRATSGKVRQPERHVWIDGTPLGAGQTGYFHLMAETIRRVARTSGSGTVAHVITTRAGREALRSRLGADADPVRFHRAGWRALHWSHIHAWFFGWHAHILLLGVAGAFVAAGLPSVAAALVVLQWAALADDMASMVASGLDRPRLRWTARMVRYFWRRWPQPHGQAPSAHTIEVIVWRGRFRWNDSRRIAIVQDLTTRILPELHTEGNVSEFDEFLGYVQRHATEIVTVSNHSRRDIIDRIAINPESVRVTPMPVHPQYEAPSFSDGVLGLHGIRGPYILCVGAIEPRKNLRRLVTAFAQLRRGDARGHRLVLVGPQAWDHSFREWLVGSDAYPAIQMLGFVPLEHLPSLYHHASAVIMPSVYEGFGIPVLEAMCCSSVVLASNVTSLPEVLGDAGMSFDPYDTCDIAAAIGRALQLTPAEAAEFRARSRRRAEVHLARLASEPPL